VPVGEPAEDKQSQQRKVIWLGRDLNMSQPARLLRASSEAKVKIILTSNKKVILITGRKSFLNTMLLEVRNLRCLS
jgi:hypothetical protein